jgi:hypothetical protein
VKSPFKVLLGTNGSEHCTDEKVKWRKCNIDILDLGSLKLNVGVPLYVILAGVKT